MKRVILMLLAVIYANVALSQEWGFGPKVGLNISKFTGLDMRSKANIDAGFSAEYKVRNVAVEADLIYSKLVNKSDFMSIPLKSKFYVYKGLNLFVGPQLDIYLSRTYGESGQNRFFGSVTGGVGYKFNNGFHISGSYNQGFTSIAHPYYKSYISGFHITVGWDILQSARSSAR